MSKSLDISMHPIFLLATSLMIRKLSVLHCAALRDLGLCFAMACQEPSDGSWVSPLQRWYLACLSSPLFGPRADKHWSQWHLKGFNSSPGFTNCCASELERGVQSRDFLGCYQIFCCAETKDTASVPSPRVWLLVSPHCMSESH